MRYLWTKRPRKAFLLLVSIQNKDRRIWIPIPVWVIEDTIDALQDIACVGEWILKLLGRNRENKRADGYKRTAGPWRQYIEGMPVSSALQAVNGVIRELRLQGRFRMIEVENEAIQIVVDLF